MYGILISSVTVGAGGASSIDFTSIPQTYTDLVLVLSIRSNYATIVDQTLISFNGTAANTNFTLKNLYGQGTAPASQSITTWSRSGYINGSTMTASTFSNSQIYVSNYTSSNAKAFSTDYVAETNGANGYQTIVAGYWNNTAAITSISLTSDGASTFAQYSTAYLYGLTKGSGGATAA